MKKKLLIMTGFAPSLVNFRSELIISLVEKGFQVHCVAPKISSDTEFCVLANLKEGLILGHDLKLGRHSLNLLSKFSSLVNFFKLLRSIAPSVALSYTAQSVILGGVTFRLAGVRNKVALITGLGIVNVNKKSLKDKFVTLLIRLGYKISLPLYDVILFQNEFDKKFLNNDCRLKHIHKQYVVEGSGVNLSKFKFLPFPNAFRVLFVGRLIEPKGVIDFLEAAKIFKDLDGIGEFVLAGDFEPSCDEGFKNRVLMLSEKANCRLMGYVKNMPAVVASSSVVVLPSKYGEGVPRALLEGLACGRPLLSTRKPGCEGTIIEGFNGFFIEENDPTTMAHSLLKLSKDPKLCRRMGNASRQLAQDKYDVYRVNKKIIKAIF